MIKQINSMKKERRLGLVFLTLLVSLSLVQTVSALGVAFPYWNTFPLYATPGEVKNIQFELQNLLGNDSVTFVAKITNGSDIAKITDTNSQYVVPAGSKDVFVNVQITVPQNAQPGSQYNVGLSFNTVTSGAGGQVEFGSAYDDSFNVIVQQNQASNTAANSTWTNNNMNYLIIGIFVILVLIVVFLLVKRKRRQ